MLIKKDADKARDKVLFIFLILINLFNVMDIWTTKIFTNDFTDFSSEGNEWLVANAEAGYLDIWFLYYKLPIIFFWTSSLFLGYHILYHYNKKSGRVLQWAILYFVIYKSGSAFRVVLINIFFILGIPFI